MRNIETINADDYCICEICNEQNHVDLMVPVSAGNTTIDVCVSPCFKTLDLVWRCGNDAECGVEFAAKLPTHCPKCGSEKISGEFTCYDSLIRDAQEVEEIIIKRKEEELAQLKVETINHLINTRNCIYQLNSLLQNTALKPCESLTSSEGSQGVGV